MIKKWLKQLAFSFFFFFIQITASLDLPCYKPQGNSLEGILEVCSWTRHWRTVGLGPANTRMPASWSQGRHRFQLILSKFWLLIPCHYVWIGNLSSQFPHQRGSGNVGFALIPDNFFSPTVLAIHKLSLNWISRDASQV